MGPVESGKRENYFVDEAQKISPVYIMEQCYTEQKRKHWKHWVAGYSCPWANTLLCWFWSVVTQHRSWDSTISFIKQLDCPARMFPNRLFWDTAKRATQPYGAKIVLQPEIIWLFSESWGQTYIFWGAQSLFLMWKHLTERHNDSLYSPFPPTKGVIHKFISCSFFI